MYSGKVIKKGMIVLAWGSTSLVALYLLLPHRQSSAGGRLAVEAG